jgi:hypothetical protein
MICPIPVITIISTGIIRIIGITGTGIADARSRYVRIPLRQCVASAVK